MTTVRRARGLRLLGPVEGSGFNAARYLVRRDDGQVVQLSELLFLVLQHADGAPLDEVAERVSEGYGRRVDANVLQALAQTKLEPLALVNQGRRPAAPPPTARPLLALGARRVLLPVETVRRVAATLAPLCSAPVALLVATGVLAVDMTVIGRQLDVRAVLDVFRSPSAVLVVMLLAVASTLFHEVGHAAACRRAGGRPGAIGFGLYLVLPAFYTDVTDAYRLTRRGRLLTDVGGIYFNGLFIVAAGVLYGLTGYQPLLVAVVFAHLEAFQQLLPVVRLDGYWMVSDLAGVPDLFAFTRPVLARLVPWRHAGGRMPLRPRARLIVSGWVLLFIPMLTVNLGLLVFYAPRLVVTASRTAGADLLAAGRAVADGSVLTALVALLSSVIVLLPVAGLAVMAGRVGLALGRWLLSPRNRPAGATASNHAPQESAVEPYVHQIPEQHEWRPAPVDTEDVGLDLLAGEGDSQPTPPRAEDFTESAMLLPRRRAPRHGWRRVVYSATMGAVNPGPSPAEIRERELIQRVRKPIRGSRRVVVLSRKGGAGKTTTTLMLGHTFAAHRGDRVLALDANPDAGSLGHRVRRENAATVTTLLAELDQIDRYADVRAFTSQDEETRLEVIASDDDPRISQALGESDYHKAIRLLDRHYNLLLLDTGTGILDSAIQGILREADQLVVVMPPALDGARVAASTLDWLEQHGYAHLVRSAVAVINAVGEKGLVQLDRVEDHFQERCSATIRIPWDPMLQAGARTPLEELRPATRQAYLELAAAVADGFLHMARPRSVSAPSVDGIS